MYTGNAAFDEKQYSYPPMKRPILLLAYLLAAHISFAQWFAEPLVGFRQDMNNTDLHMFNAGVQLAWKTSRYYELLFLVQRSLPSAIKYQQAAFTSNTALPLSVNVQKTLSPSAFNVAIGNRFFMAGKHSANKLMAKVYAGYMSQVITAEYSEYDKTNYILLNPDKQLKVDGVFLAFGFEFIRSLGNNRVFAAIDFSTPPSGQKPADYPNSFRRMAPFTINLGYSIAISKK